MNLQVFENRRRILNSRPIHMVISAFLGGLLIAVAWSPAMAQVQQRFGVRTPLRDGVELVSDLWLPETPGRYPTVLVRTPYLKAKERWVNLGHTFAREGYAFIVQDVRGRGDSEGEFDFFFADGEDGFDTIEWIGEQNWSNGQVGMMGGSYRATVQWLAARERPTPLVCLFPQAAAGRYFDELPYMGGAFLMEWALDWMNGTAGRIGQGANAGRTDWDKVYAHRPLITMDSVMGRAIPLYRDALTHSTADEYWQRILFSSSDFAEMDIPALTVTGWFDADQPGAVHYWEGMRAYSPARDQQYFLSGPWNHGETRTGGSPTIGQLERTSRSMVDIDALALSWFNHCLKQEPQTFDFPRARVFLTGTNEWRDLADYPPPNMEQRRLYLHSNGHANTLYGDGTLTWNEPADEPSDGYLYNPRHPVPSGPAQVGEDQRVVQRRDDVLVYTTEVLEAPLSMLGRVWVVIHASTDARDTDFVAKLTDVYPDGRALLLGTWPAGVIRARYREGRDREVLVTPGEVEEYRIELFDMGHTFLPGHRVRIEITSSAHPFINPNQNTGNPVATDVEWRDAQQIIYHDQERPSYVLLPVLPEG